MKVLKKIAVSVMLTTLLAGVLAACSHSDSGQDAASNQQVAANQTNAKASEPVQTGASVASSIQPTATEHTSTQPAGSTSSSQTNSAAPQVAAPAIASTIVPVAPTIAAPTGPDRTQAMVTTGCNQRSCQ